MSKRSVDNKKKKKLAISAIILVAAVVGCGTYVAVNNVDVGNLVSTIIGTPAKAEQEIIDEGGIYITETSYDGEISTSSELFAYPFRYKTTSYYSNKLLTETLGEDVLASYADSAEQIVEQLYTFDYRKVANDYDNEYNNRLNLLNDTQWAGEFSTEYDLSRDEYLSEMIKTFSDAKLQIMTTYDTNRYMVFMNGSNVFVRGIMNVKVYNIEENANLADWFPCKLEKGGEYEFVFDIRLRSEYMGDESSQVQMTYYDYVDNISKNADEVVNNYLIKDYLNEAQEQEG